MQDPTCGFQIWAEQASFYAAAATRELKKHWVRQIAATLVDSGIVTADIADIESCAPPPAASVVETSSSTAITNSTDHHNATPNTAAPTSASAAAAAATESGALPPPPPPPPTPLRSRPRRASIASAEAKLVAAAALRVAVGCVEQDRTLDDDEATTPPRWRLMTGGQPRDIEISAGLSPTGHAMLQPAFLGKVAPILTPMHVSQVRMVGGCTGGMCCRAYVCACTHARIVVGIVLLLFEAF